MKNQFKVGSSLISKKSPSYIIAEIGMNHNGSRGLAKDMIRAAARAGANAVKFQSFKTEDFLSAKFFDFEERKKFELSPEDHKVLSKEAKKCGVEFLSTPLDNFSLELLDKLNVNIFKIASCDLNNIPFIKDVAKKKKPVIFSTGYASMNEIHEAYQTLKKFGSGKIIIMHCVASYPTAYEDINLINIQSLQNMFPDAIIGFSDHSLDYLNIPSVAVGLGARVIEKHFTIDQKLEGYDHHMSLDEDMFSQMVNNIRTVERSLGKSRQEIGLIGDEETRILNARRSLFWALDIPKGTKITKKHLIAKRPGRGLEPNSIGSIIGKVLSEDVILDTLVNLKEIG
ncbi:N-acetylneuraminate synthase family protein [SAR86 cluster bacterium]|nr:N-acetylneuraminate synthase family protein [SAR86 cluster bacterium]